MTVPAPLTGRAHVIVVGGGRGGKKFQSFCSVLPAHYPQTQAFPCSSITWQEVTVAFGRETAKISAKIKNKSTMEPELEAADVI